MEKVKLFCLPFAGGNKYSYQPYVQLAPDFLEIIPLELPGRGARIKEDLLTNLDLLVNDAFNQIKDHLSEPYAIYGHSMGSIMGYLLTKKIIESGLDQPLYLFLTGCTAPCLIYEKDIPRHSLPKDEFIERLRDLGGCPEEILNDDSLMSFFEPILRADFEAVESYFYQETEPFDIPITVINGLDESIPYEDALHWQAETSEKIEVRQFPGGHFFIFDFPVEIVKIISRKLNSKVLSHG